MDTAAMKEQLSREAAKSDRLRDCLEHNLTEREKGLERIATLEKAAREAIEWLESCKALTNHRTKLAAAALKRGLGEGE